MIFVILTALALQAPMSPAEKSLTDLCLREGGSEAECACGLMITRERFSPREMDLFAEMAPIVAANPEPLVALGEAAEMAQQQGYTPGEITTALQKAFANAEEIEMRCEGAGEDG